MKNFKNYTLTQLREKYIKCIKVEERTSKFLNLEYALEKEIAKRQRALIYKTCCKVLKNMFCNQFYSAKLFTKVVMDKEICTTDYHYEIDKCFTKSKNPVVVYFD